MNNALAVVSVIIIVQLFYAFGITLYTHALGEIPEGANYLDVFNDVANADTLESTGTQLQSSISQQTNIPILEAGALVFYSGNIILDLLLNFATALPQMLGILISTLTNFFSIEYQLAQPVQLFATVAVFAWYIITLIGFLANIRSGSRVA